MAGDSGNWISNRAEAPVSLLAYDGTTNTPPAPVRHYYLAMKAFCIVLPVLFALTAVRAGAQQDVRCPQDYLDKKAMNQIVSARSIAELERAWRGIAAPDSVATFIYAFRGTQLRPGSDSDDAFIAALPADSVTFDLLYSLCYPQHPDVSDALAKIAGGSWLNPALEAVLRRHHGYRKLLMLAYVGGHNADIGETIPCLLSELKHRAPRAYQNALKQLPEAARSAVCPTCC